MPTYDSPSPATEPSYDSAAEHLKTLYDSAKTRERESRWRTGWNRRAQERQEQLEQQRQEQQEQQQRLRRRRRQDVGRFEAEQRMAGRRRSELRSALEQQATLFDILGLAQQERRRTMG